MKISFKNGGSDQEEAFSRCDLCAVLVALAILSSFSLSALSSGKLAVQAAGCVENEREIMRAWAVYAQASNGILAPDQDNGSYGNWVSGDVGHTDATGQTNFGVLNNTWLPAGYHGRPSLLGDLLPDYRIFRCPGEPWIPAFPSQGSSSPTRVRNYSMNGAVGTKISSIGPVDGPWLTGVYGGNTAQRGPYRTFGTISSFDMPGPANTWVLVHENPMSINDAVFAASMAVPDQMVDWPTLVHANGAGVSFVDGHAIIKHWVDARTQLTGTSAQIVPNNPDVEWLKSVTTARVNLSPLSISPSP
jgi:prepilin-type processing-associated H-X9-DG protein